MAALIALDERKSSPEWNLFGVICIMTYMSTDALALPNDPVELKALLLRERWHHEEVVKTYEETVQSQHRKLEQQEQTIAQLLRRLYGVKQERVDPSQLMLFSAEDLAALVEEATEAETEGQNDQRRPRRRRRGHGRRPLPDHLPREQVIHELSEQERHCPCCGETRAQIGREISEQLEYVPASFKVIEHVRIKYACKSCEEHVAIAAKPPQPIDKGLAGPGLLAQLIVSKYGDHMPLYRQEDIFMRHGVCIRRSTQCGWLAGAADLVQPLYDRMVQRTLESKILHTDDTAVKMLDPTLGHARTARFWAYIGDAAHPYSVYDFTTSRKRDGPDKFLSRFEGYLQADAYGGYDGIYLDSGGKIVEVGCWAHCRRYWWEAIGTDSRRAHEALSYIGQLNQCEDTLAELDSQRRGELRREHALPILESFGDWIKQQSTQVLPKSPIGHACTYTLNQWDALLRYCEDGDLSIDNNVAERTMKIPAIGRKNWLFVASETGGHRAAILFSLTASCKANEVEPFAYLSDVLARMPTQPVDQLDELLPDRWLKAHPEHRWQIDAIRRKERRQRRSRNRSARST
jgi:transposase